MTFTSPSSAEDQVFFYSTIRGLSS